MLKNKLGSMIFYREQRCIQRKTENLKLKESIEFLTTKVFPITAKERNQRRKEKNKLTAPKQRMLNTRRSFEWHKMLVHCNFDTTDTLIHCTFSEKNRPRTQKEINNEFKNYIKRINRRRKKLGLDNAKYIAVIEGLEGECNVHFHIIMDGDLDRETLETLWNGKGIVNANRLQMNEEGVTALIKYMMKLKKDKNLDDEMFEKGKYKRAWRSSKGNLKKPKVEVNDCKFTRRKMMEFKKNHPSREEIERMYPGYILTDFQINQNDEYGQFYMVIEMRRYVKNEKIKGTNLYKPISKRKEREINERRKGKTSV
ncbi:rolling circle replication-associated protein [Clostridium baratii]|uniref:rolling circle replication-associated protein n=1 Tax=Clostridium baratii TaxID=1561 RepID=UPI0030D42F54